MKRVMTMMFGLIFGMCSLAVACGCGGYRGGDMRGFSGAYGPGSCCSYASNTQTPSCCLPGNAYGGNPNPRMAPGSPAPRTK